MIMKLLPPGGEKRMSYCCWCKGPGINGWATLILKDSSGLYAIFDFLSGFEEFMEEYPWGHLATS
jgi:hypothetical protein